MISHARRFNFGHEVRRLSSSPSAIPSQGKPCHDQSYSGNLLHSYKTNKPFVEDLPVQNCDLP